VGGVIAKSSRNFRLSGFFHAWTPTAPPKISTSTTSSRLAEITPDFSSTCWDKTNPEVIFKIRHTGVDFCARKKVEKGLDQLGRIVTSRLPAL